MKSTLGILTTSLFLAFACGGSDDDGNGGGNQNLSPAEAVAACQVEGMSSGGESPCEGIDEYVECAQTQCQAEYKTCLGEGYESGNFSGGSCEEAMQCVADASDKCNNNCFPTDLNDPCLSCIVNTVGACVQQKCLSLLDCSGAGGGGGGGDIPQGTCDDLEACCDSLPAEDASQCTSMLTASSGVDQACAATLNIYVAAGQCSG